MWNFQMAIVLITQRNYIQMLKDWGLSYANFLARHFKEKRMKYIFSNNGVKFFVQCQTFGVTCTVW